MNILIAPDSFKESLTAVDFCHTVAQAIRHNYGAVHITQLPMADGGEGTIDALLANVKGKLYSVAVQDPLSRIINSQYAILEDQQVAVIEMARASGLPLLNSIQRNPMYTSSYGTGELILAALNQGCRRFIITLGGSATNEGGMGMLAALGVRFLDYQQQPVADCGEGLQKIHSIDLSSFDQRLQECHFTIASDVTNPLLGEQGATAFFAIQKGADKNMLPQLEKGMQHFVNKTATLIASAHSLALQAGAGAAGGMGFALMAYCHASMQSGFELLANINGLNTLLENKHSRPDLIITGEGCFDKQSLKGKLVGRLYQKAKRYHIPLIIISGCQSNDRDKSLSLGKSRLYCLQNDEMPLEYSMNNANKLLYQLITELEFLE